ncbi:hypothetical protein HZ326_28415 [Fusarium oxysporum f. sp. albedinis]|nr:hypothetical protein HZ326_28415 [Fusarium oxysporum f. sp. albedinis]
MASRERTRNWLMAPKEWGQSVLAPKRLTRIAGSLRPFGIVCLLSTVPVPRVQFISPIRQSSLLIYSSLFVLVVGRRDRRAGLQSTPLNPRVDPLSGSTIHSTRLSQRPTKA